MIFLPMRATWPDFTVGAPETEGHGDRERYICRDAGSLPVDAFSPQKWVSGGFPIG